MTTHRITANRGPAGAGVQLETTEPVSVTANRIFDDDLGMQLVLGGALVRNNVVSDNDQGILITNSAANNKLERNDFRGNAGFDCQDESVGLNPSRRGFPFYTTVNQWVSIRGFDADPGPICTPSGAAGRPL